VIGRNQCPIVDTWWQTETGGFMILPLPGAIPIKPALATLPSWGGPHVGGRYDGSGDHGNWSVAALSVQTRLARLHQDDLR